MKSITITYFFLLLIVGLFLFTGNTSSKSIESKKVKTKVMLIDSKPNITLTSYSEEKTHNAASTQLESFSNISFKEFNALIPQKELRNHLRINIRFMTLKI